MTDKTVNPFDFSDLSDLPEELAGKLHTDTDENARVYAEVVAKGAAAGMSELTINQIMAAAMRMGHDVPTQQTVRGYLNRAEKLGLIGKPTRQTYGIAGDATAPEKPAPKTPAKAEATKTDDPVVTSDETPDNDDPLAAMGLS